MRGQTVVPWPGGRGILEVVTGPRRGGEIGRSFRRFRSNRVRHGREPGNWPRHRTGAGRARRRRGDQSHVGVRCRGRLSGCGERTGRRSEIPRGRSLRDRGRPLGGRRRLRCIRPGGLGPGSRRYPREQRQHPDSLRFRGCHSRADRSPMPDELPHAHSAPPARAAPDGGTRLGPRLDHRQRAAGRPDDRTLGLCRPEERSVQPGQEFEPRVREVGGHHQQPLTGPHRYGSQPLPAAHRG